STSGVQDGHGFAYIPNSYQAFGNNGTHGINNPIDSASNTAQPANVKTALAAVLDHLPVVADYQLPAKMAATATSVPAQMIVGAVSPMTVTVNNAAPVLFSNGADVLNYTLSATGALSGSTSGSDAALGTTNTHTVSVS